MRRIGLPVTRAVRIAIGPKSSCGKLRPGEFRDLTTAEVNKLKQAVKRKVAAEIVIVGAGAAGLL